MIYFGIPLRSKKASKDWNEVTRVFNRTLRSVYRQTNPAFKIYVACHEVPLLDAEYDERVEFLTADTPVPTTKFEMMLDKGWKISMIAQKIREAGGGYTMMVDSDDLVSNRIAEYAAAHPEKTGFISRYGYIYNDGFSYVKKALHMYRICGSCAVVRYSTEDLPDYMPKDLWDDSLKEKWIVRMSHRKIPDYLQSIGRALETIPFPTTIYVRNTGDNHSMLNGSDLSKKRKLELMIRRRIPITEKMREEYGL